MRASRRSQWSRNRTSGELERSRLSLGWGQRCCTSRARHDRAKGSELYLLTWCCLKVFFDPLKHIQSTKELWNRTFDLSKSVLLDTTEGAVSKL